MSTLLATSRRALAFALFLPAALLLALFRTGKGALIGFLLGLLGAAAWHLFLPVVIDHGVFRWGAKIGIALGALCGLVSSLRETFLAPPPLTSHGSARWASPGESAAFALARGAGQQGLSSLLVGREAAGRRRLLAYDGPAHLITIAPTRSGKGVGTVLPNLLLARRSVLCIDPKGENARISARARRRFGPVHVLDPFGVSGQPASRYDPLAVLDPISPDLAEDVATLADALVYDPPGQAGEAHWNEEAKALIAGLLLHTLTAQPPERRRLAALRDALTLPPARFQALLADMAASPEAGGLVARAANRQLGKSDREAAGVLSSAQRHTHFLDGPRIAAAMDGADFRFEDLRRGVGSVFLVLPPDRLDTYSRWLRLLVAQAIQHLARSAMEASTLQAGPLPFGTVDTAPGLGSRPPVLFLLDEFAALGRLDPVERAMGLMAGLGIQLWPILQDLHQLRATYGQRAGTFLSNAGLVQVASPADLETATWLSRTLGSGTVAYETASASSSHPAFLSGGHASEGEGTSTHLAARPLLTPDEAMRLRPDLQVLLRPGHRPVLAAKLRHYEDREFRGLFDA
ncbi:type IV secretory system conjugative DNA transfer family protein [Roseomonas sp. KE2513]|uniref:type IV secretory system conjugative DNA transfer family protein n=1 Tax=Roseomonas sp. KE2513 TaxID=2479202 RepID=UPI0018DF25C8|nr:type IV secretory system conjugative DNA transfer family protein [Roseomonas sp. KE2513]MBI0539136.1 type IV secretory system conjugative DNA transfer family protein [Roseomonas sp. KE2513]